MPSLHSYDVKWPSFNVYWKRERLGYKFCSNFLKRLGNYNFVGFWWHLSDRAWFFRYFRLWGVKHEWNIFTVLAPAANTTNIDYEPSLFFYCSQSTANNDTKSLFLPHQKQWPAWDPNNERRIINNCQKAQRIVFTKASALSLQTIRSSFMTVFM